MLIGWDKASKEGDYSCKIYGKIKNGELYIKKVKYYKYKPEKEVKKYLCLECGNVYIDCRDLIFCTYKGNKYVGRKKDYKTPEWCPKEAKDES